MLVFDSLNPYQKLETFTADTHDELKQILRSSPTPITVLSIHANATMTKWVAFVVGDIRIKQMQQIKLKKGVK